MHDHHHDDGPCCDACASGKPCEGCDGAGGCGNDKCGCNVAQKAMWGDPCVEPTRDWQCSHPNPVTGGPAPRNATPPPQGFAWGQGMNAGMRVRTALTTGNSPGAGHSGFQAKVGSIPQTRAHGVAGFAHGYRGGMAGDAAYEAVVETHGMAGVQNAVTVSQAASAKPSNHFGLRAPKSVHNAAHARRGSRMMVFGDEAGGVAGAVRYAVDVHPHGHDVYKEVEGRWLFIGSTSHQAAQRAGEAGFAGGYRGGMAGRKWGSGCQSACYTGPAPRQAWGGELFGRTQREYHCDPCLETKFPNGGNGPKEPPGKPKKPPKVEVIPPCCGIVIIDGMGFIECEGGSTEHAIPPGLHGLEVELIDTFVDAHGRTFVQAKIDDAYFHMPLCAGSEPPPRKPGDTPDGEDPCLKKVKSMGYIPGTPRFYKALRRCWNQHCPSPPPCPEPEACPTPQPCPDPRPCPAPIPCPELDPCAKRAQLMGLRPGHPKYQEFMRDCHCPDTPPPGGPTVKPAVINECDRRAIQAGYQPGTQAYKDYYNRCLGGKSPVPPRPTTRPGSIRVPSRPTPGDHVLTSPTPRQPPPGRGPDTLTSRPEPPYIPMQVGPTRAAQPQAAMMALAAGHRYY